MSSYRQYCPVAKALEVLGERWTLLIVRELLAGIERFNDLARGLPGVPRSLLIERLRRLERAGVIRREGTGSRAARYVLTDAGRRLEAVVDALGRWVVEFAFGLPDEAELDPGLLLWWMDRRVVAARLPRRRTVIEFDFVGARRGRYWLVIEYNGDD